jgi:hypothetical protein
MWLKGCVPHPYDWYTLYKTVKYMVSGYKLFRNNKTRGKSN